MSRNRESAFEELAMNQQVSLVNGLMRGNYGEEKLAAILYVQMYWLDRMKGGFLMNLVSDWFDDLHIHDLHIHDWHIHDWNTTDWLCVRIITPLEDSGDPQVIWKLKQWNRDPYLWKARASLISFARAKYIG